MVISHVALSRNGAQLALQREHMKKSIKLTKTSETFNLKKKITVATVKGRQ